MNFTKSPKQTRITYICLNFYLPYSKLRTKQYHISLFQTWFTITDFHLRKFSPLGSHCGKSSGSYFLSIESGFYVLEWRKTGISKPGGQAYISITYLKSPIKSDTKCINNLKKISVLFFSTDF